MVAYGAGRKDLSARERVQRKLFQRMIQLDGRDRQLVKHCLLYHQFDLNYDACKGIAWDRPVEPKMRDARLVRLWTKMMTATRREIARSKFFDGDDIALVQTCL